MPGTANGTATRDFVRRAAGELGRLTGQIERSAHEVDALARWTADLILAGSRLLICGNGGSAPEGPHFSTGLRGRYRAERRPLPALALPADGTLLTCICNDYSADMIFARQVAGLGRPGDLLVALTTSGKSRNVLAAVAAARQYGLHTLALLGKDGGDLARRAERQAV